MTDNDIYQILSTYCAAAGRKTPSREVCYEGYLWRYANSFLQIMEEAQVPQQLYSTIISEVARQTKNNASNIANKKLILQAIDTIISSGKITEELIEDLKRSHNFAHIHHFNFLHRDRPNGYPNIVVWYMGKQLSDIYLSLSHLCHIAMAELPQDERSVLPSAEIISRWRMRYISNKDLNKAAKQILLSDIFMREPCVRS